MTVIRVNDGMCWMCGEKTANTEHHGIPKHLDPKHNIIVPVCKDCHEKINSGDIFGIIKYATKTMRHAKDAVRGAWELKKLMTMYYAENFTSEQREKYKCNVCNGTGKKNEVMCNVCSGTGIFISSKLKGGKKDGNS